MDNDMSEETRHLLTNMQELADAVIAEGQAESERFAKWILATSGQIRKSSSSTAASFVAVVLMKACIESGQSCQPFNPEAALDSAKLFILYGEYISQVGHVKTEVPSVFNDAMDGSHD